MFEKGDVIYNPTNWGNSKYYIVAVERREYHNGFHMTLHNLEHTGYEFPYYLPDSEAVNVLIDGKGNNRRVEHKIAMMWQRQPYVKKAAEVSNV